MGVEDIPDRMLAAQIIEYNEPYTIHEVPTPKKLEPYDLLVKTAVASLCHTGGFISKTSQPKEGNASELLLSPEVMLTPPDFMVRAGAFGTKLPCTGSHEGAGTVAALGHSVTSFNVGDRVMCGLTRGSCGKCEDCVAPPEMSRIQYCQHSTGSVGINIDGAFAEYTVVDSRHAARLPDSVSFETAAPLACAGGTVWRGVLQAGLKEGQWLGIVGSGGGLGHLGIRFAKALGLRVVGVDARDGALHLSRDCGADLVVDARKGDESVVENVRGVTDGKGVDVTLNVSDAKGAAATACAITRRHGTMIQIAQPETVDIPFMELIFRDIKVQGSLIISPEEARRMIQVIAEHKISVKTNPFEGLSELPKLVELAESGKMMGKGIVVVDRSQVEKQK